MKAWVITFKDKSCSPEVVKLAVQQDTPTITFQLPDNRFTVEFKNRSDYMASREGTLADVVIISAKRNRFIGTAINKKNDA